MQQYVIRRTAVNRFLNMDCGIGALDRGCPRASQRTLRQIMHSRVRQVNGFNRADLRHPQPAAYTDAAMRIFAQHNGLEERTP